MIFFRGTRGDRSRRFVTWSNKEPLEYTQKNNCPMAAFNNPRKRARAATGPLAVTIAKPALTPIQKKEINALIRKAEKKDEELKKFRRVIAGSVVNRMQVRTFNLFDFLGNATTNDGLIGNEFHTKYIDVSVIVESATSFLNDQKIATVAIVKSSNYSAGAGTLVNSNVLIDNTDTYPTPQFDSDKVTVVWKRTKQINPQLVAATPADTLVLFNERVKFNRKLAYKASTSSGSWELRDGNYYLLVYVYSVNGSSSLVVGTIQGGAIVHYYDA